MYRWVLLLAVFLALPIAGPQATAQADGSAPEALYLLPGAAVDLHNFTTFPPNATSPVLQGPNPPDVLHARWLWLMDHVPVRWNLTTQDELTLDVYLTGLDGLLPVADPTTDPQGVGNVVVRADIVVSDQDGSVGTASSTYQPNPVAPDDSPRRFTLTLQPTEDHDLRTEPGEARTFGVRLTVTGRAPEQEYPVRVLLGSTDAPSRFVVPGFPYAAFRAWEEEDRREAICNDRVLRGLTCEEPTATPAGGNTSNASKEGPAVDPVRVVIAGVAVMALFGWAARRR